MYTSTNISKRKDKLPTKMAHFKFLKIFRTTKNKDRDNWTARTDQSRSNGDDLVPVRVPISKSFKVYEQSQFTPDIVRITIAPTKTSFYKDDIAWWSYCCLGCWCNSCAGLLLNFKLDRNISKVLHAGMKHFDWRG